MHKFGISLSEMPANFRWRQSGTNYTVVRAAPVHQNTKSLMHGSLMAEIHGKGWAVGV